METAPNLVIIGPHRKFIEPWGADIISKFKLPAYPFTRERVAMLEIENVRELRLDMLWDRNTIFRGIDYTFFSCVKTFAFHFFFIILLNTYLHSLCV